MTTLQTQNSTNSAIWTCRTGLDCRTSTSASMLMGTKRPSASSHTVCGPGSFWFTHTPCSRANCDDVLTFPRYMMPWGSPTAAAPAASASQPCTHDATVARRVRELHDTLHDVQRR
jgi:hypothetical protein